MCSQHLQLAATTGSVQSAAELLELRGFQNYFLALSGPRFGIVFWPRSEPVAEILR